MRRLPAKRRQDPAMPPFLAGTTPIARCVDASPCQKTLLQIRQSTLVWKDGVPRVSVQGALWPLGGTRFSSRSFFSASSSRIPLPGFFRHDSSGARIVQETSSSAPTGEAARLIALGLWRDRIRRGVKNSFVLVPLCLHSTFACYLYNLVMEVKNNLIILRRFFSRS